jgi:hypothetical protein
MIARLAQRAHLLDAWLHEHVGRIYTAILAWGLVLTIIESVRALSHEFGSGGDSNVLKLGFAVAFQLALLVNQLAQWHELRERRRNRNAARKSAQIDA